MAALGTNTLGQPVSRRISLPATRTVAGALLVTAAVFIALGATSGFFTRSTTHVVVAARDLAPGTRLTTADITTTEVELDSQLAKHTIGKTEVAIGTTMTGPLKSGEIVQPGALVQTAAQAGGVEVSFALPTARAVGGTLASGEVVDVVATEKGAYQARVVASRARILTSKAAGNASLGANGDTVVTLGVATREQATAIVGAIDTGTVTLIRTTGANQQQ